MYMTKLAYFLEIFKTDVSPYYRNHEETFDLESLHGRFHILRCLLLVDALDCFYSSKGVNFDIDSAYFAVLFHDIAREGNGFDEWESESAEHCYSYLKENGMAEEAAEKISRLILKETPFSLEGQILYDVDVLDYNRFFCFPQEEDLFDKRKLIVGSQLDVSKINDEIIREKIIELAQELVIISSAITIDISTEELVNKMYESYLKLSFTSK